MMMRARSHCVLLAAISLFSLSTASGEGDQESVTFVSYNLKNYLTMRRQGPDGRAGEWPKPEDEKQILVRFLGQCHPDILGVCEIGTEEDVKDLQKRLAEKGIKLPHYELVKGWDTQRSLGLLSKFPIVNRASEGAAHFQLQGEPFQMRRGILDTTVEIGDYQLRCLGVHLKSKQPTPEADQLVMRTKEAALVRAHFKEIIAQVPETNLLLYGDFNDDRSEPPIRAIQGRLGQASYLQDLRLSDKNGERWTFCWEVKDLYQRFDYLFVNRGLLPEVLKEESYIFSDPEWNQASDHRPLVLKIIPREIIRK